MPQALAYCEEYGRNITLDEAHALFFGLDPAKRRRFGFRCGDPRCRAMLQPRVVAALYDREDEPGKKFTSPYFREHPAHPHIIGCTWIGAGGAPRGDGDPVKERAASVIDELGLVFRLKRRGGAGGGAADPSRKSEPEDEAEDDEREAESGAPSASARAPRAPSSKFMARVALRYLAYTEEQRKRIELEIEGVQKAPFYNVCMPIFAFHPHFQAKQIYHGKVRVSELTNVFMIRFLFKFSPDGDRERRQTYAEIKLLKKWLEQHDRALAALLGELAAGRTVAWCFFYADQAPVKKNDSAVFSIDDSAHLALIAEAAVEVVNPPVNAPVNPAAEA